MTRVYETEADDVFREDAAAKGYFTPDPITGKVRGLRAYYRDFGMVQPEVLEREIPQHEVTGLFLDGETGW